MICEQDRIQIAHSLGLDRAQFVYEERVGSQVLRAFLYGLEGCETLYGQNDLALPSVPRIVRRHLAQALAERSAFPVESLAEMLLPFPWNAWFGPKGAEACGSFEISDSDWQTSLDRLGNAFSVLQGIIQRAEISIVRFGPSEVAPRLFFHSVRRRFIEVRVIRSPEQVDENVLARTGASFQTLEIEPVLQDTFSAQVAELARVFAVCGEFAVKTTLSTHSSNQRIVFPHDP